MLARFLVLVTLAWLSLSGDAAAQEQATTNRATELKERPAAESRTLAPVAAETPVKLVSRQGGWTQVEAGGQRGWVRAFHLRFQSTVESSGSGGSAITSIFGFGSREAPKTSKVATLGIRGLTPDDFKNAAPNPAELRKMQSYRSDKASAERFAKEA